jgi:peptidoglycan/xylan/chitin deacetylase (PgdA/CDA1 family)
MPIANRKKIKRSIKVAISLCYFAKQTLVRSLQTALNRPYHRQLVILYYHGVPDHFRAHFARQMDAIQSKARVVPAFHRGGLPGDRPSVAITFDDAYLSVAENALPELVARGFHSTIFVPVGVLGKRPGWIMEDGSPDSEEIVMPPELVATLSSPLVSLGSHTCTHPRLSRINLEKAREEITNSRATLEKLTVREIRLLAFPYGDHSSLVVELCRAAGYDCVFSTVPHVTDTLGIDFIRGRVKTDPFDSRLEFYLKYNGAYAWMPYASAVKRKFRFWRSSR